MARRKVSSYTFLTLKEHENETGLDYSQYRYYSSTQGRFTSPDPLLASAKFSDPQSWNRYTYCGNNPLNYVDPTGLDWYRDTTEEGTIHPVWLDDDPGKDSKYVAWDGPWTYQSSESNKWIVLSNSSSQQSEYATQEAALASLAPPAHDWDPSCANCAELSHEMNRYTPALTQSMNIMGTYMFFFTGPTGEMGSLTSLGLEGTEELVNVTHFTNEVGMGMISETGTVGTDSIQPFVTLPSEIPAGANPTEIERLLEIGSGRGQYSITFQTPASNLMTPANGATTSGGALQFQLIRLAAINPNTFVRTPLALLPP
ncbi:MAG TPA: RHS repeat-associated core domain-containing protein [Pyrinomonadaceae bacterium]|nr:RHS repeat-associated core domain-containing protein [Pyrinomonadaceae bacterium]